jgi:hypothetical protein
MDPLRSRRAIGRDLESRALGTEQVGRIIEMAAEYAGEMPLPIAGLDPVENLIALLAGASALLRETSAAVHGLECELIGAGDAGEA